MSSPEPAPEKKEKVGFFKKMKVFVKERELILAESDVKDVLDELEIVLLENDVALPVTDEILRHIRHDLIGSHRKIGTSPDTIVMETLKSALLDVLGEGFDLPAYIRSHDRPVKILFTGVNGTGKTTTVAKVGAFLLKNGFSVVIGAGDTFRAGAIEQIDIHAERLGIKVIQHQQGGDHQEAALLGGHVARRLQDDQVAGRQQSHDRREQKKAQTAQGGSNRKASGAA